MSKSYLTLLFQQVMSNSSSVECGHYLVIQRVECNENVSVRLLKLGHKKALWFFFFCSLSFSPSFSSSLLWSWGCSQQPFHEDTQVTYGQAHMARNRGFLPTLCQWAMLKANPWSPVKPSNNLATANVLMATSWEALSQNHSAKLLSDPWPIATVWNNKYLLL